MHSSIVVRLYKGTFAFGFQICSKNSTFHKEKLVTPSNIFFFVDKCHIMSENIFLMKAYYSSQETEDHKFHMSHC